MCTRGETLQENRGSPLQETLKETLRKGLGEDITKKKNLEENYENKKRRTKTYFLPTVPLPSCIIHCFFFGLKSP
jgi:hypothetical protein